MTLKKFVTGLGIYCAACSKSSAAVRFTSAGVWVCFECAKEPFDSFTVVPANISAPGLVAPSKPQAKAKPVTAKAKAVEPKGALTLRFVPQGTSQKARGIGILAQLSKLETKFHVLAHRVIRMATNGAVIAEETLNGYFLRPCPQTPRHGFVDSRVAAPGVLAQLVKEIEAAGEPVEIVAMKKVDAKCSGVWTRNSLTIGHGHDGATGIGQTQTIALCAPWYGAVAKSVEHDDKKTEIYMEVVWPSDGKRPYYVQARVGPITESTADYTPHAMTVKVVLTLASDYNWQAWETQCESLDSSIEAGVVLNLPGSGLTCHAAVHAKIHGITIITTHVVKVGEQIEVGQAPIVATPLYPSIAFGFLEGFKDAGVMDPLLGLAAVHAMASIDLGNEAHARALGYGLGKMVKCALLCSGGEARYAGAYDLPWVQTHKGKHRDDVYMIVKTWNAYEIARHAVVWEVMHSNYGGTGFSGVKWATATKYAIALLRAFTVDLAALPTAFVETMAIANKLAVCCHNGGRLFNKLTSSSLMNLASIVPGEFFAPSLLLEPTTLTPKQAASDVEAIGFGLDDGAHAAKDLVKLAPVHHDDYGDHGDYGHIGQYQIRATASNSLRVQHMNGLHALDLGFSEHTAACTDEQMAAFLAYASLATTIKALSLVKSPGVYYAVVPCGRYAIKGGKFTILEWDLSGLIEFTKGGA